MKEICTPKDEASTKEMASIIMLYIKGGNGQMINGHLLLTEKMRQYFTWGACKFLLIGSKCGCYGLQFHVSGLQFKGRVRIYYNPSSDYFDVEFLRPRKDETIQTYEDIDFLQLHNICHQFIERKDDPEV